MQKDEKLWWGYVNTLIEIGLNKNYNFRGTILVVTVRNVLNYIDKTTIYYCYDLMLNYLKRLLNRINFYAISSQFTPSIYKDNKLDLEKYISWLIWYTQVVKIYFINNN